MKHDKVPIQNAHVPIIKTEVKPSAPSITEEDVKRRIAVAVHSEHAAGSAERLKAVEDAIAATREVCAQECDSRVTSERLRVLNTGTQDQTYAVEVAVTAAYEACAQICDLHFFSAYAAKEIRKRAKKR